MELEQKIERYKELGQRIAELEMQKKALVAENIAIHP